MNEDVIDNMRSRVTRFRRLAAMMTDKRAIEVLEQMVHETEADIRSLEQRSGDGSGASDQQPA